jgi:ankyrin repeat protein
MSLLRYAELEGHDDIAQLLRSRGAVPEQATDDEEVAFVRACIRGDRDAAAAMVREQPRFVQRPHLLFEAAKRNRTDVLALLLDLGAPVNVQERDGRTALHEAAASNTRDAAALLLERGADADRRESQFQATPLGFASYHDHREMIDLLTPHSRDAWILAARGKLARLREVLRAEPQRAGGLDPRGRSILWYLPDDEADALEVVEVLLAAGAAPSVKAKDGTTAADAARALGLDRVAERLEAAAR